MTSYKTILACLDDIETAASTLGLAFLVGKDHSAHVDALHVMPDPSTFMPLIGETVAVNFIEDVMTQAEARAREKAGLIRDLFEKTCASQTIPITEIPVAEGGVTAAWREAVGAEDEIVAKAGQLTDLVVMARCLPDRDAAIARVNSVLLESGRALLLAPTVLPKTIGRTVAIFWNGSVEASRAVAAAMPFLRHASKVVILSAVEDYDAEPGALARYFGWHGIPTRIHTVRADSDNFDVGQTLVNEAKAAGADLVVMGAYTHSRLRQLILGGVTRHMLQTADLPVLLSH